MFHNNDCKDFDMIQTPPSYSKLREMGCSFSFEISFVRKKPFFFLQDALEREKKEEEEKHREATGGKKEEKVEEVKVEVSLMFNKESSSKSRKR